MYTSMEFAPYMIISAVPEIVVGINNIFENDKDLKHQLIKYLKRSFEFCLDKHFSLTLMLLTQVANLANTK